MAAFKTLNSQDIVVSPLNLNKGFNFKGATALTSSNVNIGRYLGKNVNFLNDKSTTGPTGNTEFQSLVYNQAKQLYYTNYISGSSGNTSIVSTASFNPDDPTQIAEIYNAAVKGYKR